MVPSLRVPSTHRERETSLPRSCTTLTPSDDERDVTDQTSHERSSEDVTATPSRDETSTPITAKHFAEDISDTLRPSPWSKKILLALGKIFSHEPLESNMVTDKKQTAVECEDTRHSLYSRNCSKP